MEKPSFITNASKIEVNLNKAIKKEKETLNTFFEKLKH